jgi:threonine dehydratase
VDRPDRRSARILSRVAPEPTPLEEAPAQLRGRRRLYLKREDLHELGSFKWRGALPTLEAYRADGAQMVVTASTGNHGAATAWAAQRVGMRAVVYTPERASAAKLGVIERFGADVRLVGADLDESKEEARRFTAERGLPFFEDGAERTQYEGYRAVGDEILGQLGAPPAAVVVPVGNGALLGGIAIEICRRAHETVRIGVAAKEAPVMAESFEAGHPVESSRSSTFADGLAVRVAVPLAVSVLGEVATRIVLVSEREIARALGAFARAGIRVEGAAAAGLAGLSDLEDVGDPVVLVVTGRNVDDEVFTRAVERPDSFPD